MQRRVYVPVTRRTLMELRAGGGLAGTPLPAFAVTEGLCRDNPGADQEELEYLAFLQAAAAAPGAQRVVAAVDVEGDSVVDAEADADSDSVAEGDTDVATRSSSAVRVTSSVPLRLMASFHVEESPRTSGADQGEFLWYDATEIDTVVDLLT